MTRSAATIAIVATRLRKELRVIVLACAACAMLAYLQRYEDALSQLAGTLVFGTLAGIAAALLQRGSGRFRELELCEQAAPLYGRELARASALVPCIIVSAALAAYWIAQRAFSDPPLFCAALSLAGAYAATLVALSATLRTGAARVLYVVIACLPAAATFALARQPLEIALLLCALTGFLALRQYGEALARYDPV